MDNPLDSIEHIVCTNPVKLNRFYDLEFMVTLNYTMFHNQLHPQTMFKQNP